LIRNLNIIFITFFFYLLLISYSVASFEEKLFNKFKTINTLTFDFNQKIGEKLEFGNCLVKYPLLMKCEYPKKKKSIITNGKKFAIVKKRYKKIYYYPLEKTPLFYLLKKENILNLIKNYKPINIEKNIIQYEITDDNKNELKIFFNKDSLELLGWKTIDAYTNEVSFLIRNIKINALIDNKVFIIPKAEDL
jgi:outer membrane lipoprotein-sorting protein